MTLVLSRAPLDSMTSSILLRSPPAPSPFPSPSPASTPLPALQPDLSSSSSSASGSLQDFHRSSSAPPSRRIRFAPLPDPHRDLFDADIPPPDDLQPDCKLSPQPLPASGDVNDDLVALSPSVSPDSTQSSARSTPTIRISPNAPPHPSPSKSKLKFLRNLFRGSSSSPLSQSASLPTSRNASVSSLIRSSTSLPSSPVFQPTKLPLFRPRSESSGSSRSARPLSPPPKPDLHRSASTGSAPVKHTTGKRDWGENSQDVSGSRKQRASSVSTPGAGGGRHASAIKLHPGDIPSRPSGSSLPPKKHVKMLNGRIYGAKRYAAQTLANPFANVRDEPEFVEWGYGGMGSVQASAGIANDMWKGLQRSERGGALLAGSSFDSSSPSSLRTAGAFSVGGGRGSGAHATSPIARRKMSSDIPECGMGNVGSGGDDDDGSGMGWVRRRRAEREAKARLEQQAKELEKAQEGRRSIESMDASMYASTASTTTSLTACTSGASTGLTTPTTSPLTSRSPSVTDLKLTSSPLTETREFVTANEQPLTSDIPMPPAAASKDEHEHHILTAVRLSPSISNPTHKHNHSTTHGRSASLSQTLSQIDGDHVEQAAPLSPVDTEETTSSGSFSEDEDEPIQGSDDEERDVDDDEDEAQDTKRKTALGAGVEKISRHVDVDIR